MCLVSKDRRVRKEGWQRRRQVSTAGVQCGSWEEMRLTKSAVLPGQWDVGSSHEI